MRMFSIIILGLITAALAAALLIYGIISPPGAHRDKRMSDADPASEVHAAETGLKAGMVDPETGKTIKYWVAPMDPAYIRNEPGKSPMGMDLVPVYEEIGEGSESAGTIRIDPVIIQNMGVRVAVVQRKPLVKHIRTFGRLIHDETRVTEVNTKYAGWIETLFVDFTGKAVRRYDPLFQVYSPELVTAQNEYLLALKQFETLKESSFRDIRDGAERLLKASRIRLELWGLTPGQMKAIENRRNIIKSMTVYAPASGVVTRKNTRLGTYVTAGETLYEITDLSVIWVDVEIYEYEMPWVKPGMSAQMTLSYIPGRGFTGTVKYIYPYLNEKTRTARLRLEFPNPDGLLKPGMYVNVDLTPALGESGLVVPQEAVIDSGVRKIVFVSHGNGKFEPREVVLGVETENHAFHVLEGLKQGEKVVTSAQFMFDSESRLREAIGKMLEAGQENPNGDTLSEPTVVEDGAEDLDMSNLTMNGVE
ncbi:MAG: efflux RND transporter periplasmic adaptor subunit [Desulfobacterales bacterium]